MKTKSLILAGLAVLALVSCNKEKNESPFSEDGDNAYLSVQIAYANGAATRGEEDSTNPFYYGSAEENAVKTADFFFYMSDGAYFSHVTQAISGKGETHATTPADGNIEWVGNGVVVLKGLTSTTSPAYMAVVLNGSAKLLSDLEGLSRDEAHLKVKTTDLAQTVSGTLTNFTMTNAVSSNTNLGDDYCAKLTREMFKETEAEAASTADVVVAYVERIAAKVTLSVDETAMTATTVGGNKIYKIGAFEIDNATGTTKDLYIKIHGWGLNGTTKDSYSFKNIDDSWTTATTSLGFTWNEPTNFRSYWAESTNYGDATCKYPRTYNNDNTSSLTVYNAASANMPLSYTNYTACTAALGENAYCHENTNTFAILDANNFNTTATCVLLTAQVVDATGADQTLFLYENKYWTEDGYKNRVLAKYISDVYTDATATTAVTKDNLVINDDNDGLVHLTFDATKTYYKSTNTAYTANEVEALLTRAMTEAVGYNDGMMYYSIPIEHLRNSGTFAANSYAEADYGVVRNHWYNLTVSKIANLGHGVWTPGETIVPDDNDTKKYYVAAKINILSWKVVKQSVEL